MLNEWITKMTLKLQDALQQRLEVALDGVETALGRKKPDGEGETENAEPPREEEKT